MTRPRRGAAAAALVVAGAVLVMTAGPAMGDGTATAGAGAGASGGPGALGGYTLTATGSGVRVTYEQPNFPVPATPSLETNLGFSTASFDAGPTGESLASAFWPGSVAANGASQLNLLLGGYLQPAFGPNTPTLPNPGPWPVEAATAYPQGPDTQRNDNGTVAMDASSTGAASSAQSALGALGQGTAVPTGLVQVQTVGSDVTSTVDAAGQAVAQATSAVHGVSIAGGLITVGAVTSSASAASDGNQATMTGTSTVAQVSVAGQPVTVDASGVHAPASPAPIPILGALTPSVAQVLSTAGITMSLTSPTDTVNGAQGERQLDGLQVAIDLSTFDKNVSTLVTTLPAQLASQIEQLPLPLPDSQLVTIDLGWVDVDTAASPPFDATGAGAPGAGAPGATGASTATGNTGSGGTGFVPGTSGSPGAAGAGTTTGTPSGAPGAVSALSTAPVALFRGIGAGLIVLGLALAGLVALALLRADRAVGLLTAAALPCDDVGLGA
jgi:hypothetical protein